MTPQKNTAADDGALAPHTLGTGGQQTPSPGWREIESAPFDETVIMLWREGDREAYPGWWLGTEGSYEWAFIDETSGRSHKGVEPNAYLKGDGPTHWMPLPEPPYSGGGKGE